MTVLIVGLTVWFYQEPLVMNNLRVFLSLSIFVLSTYLVIDLLINSFDGLLLLFSLIGFVCVHYLWPAKHDDDTEWYDILEIVIELPYRAIAVFIRGLGSLFKNSDSGIL